MQEKPICDQKRGLWQEPLICFAILLLTLPFIYFLSKSGFDSHHTGLMYKGALDVANGKLLFLETFTQYGALTTYIQALFLLIFGKQVTSILLSTALFYALNYLLLYRISRHFLGRVLSLVGVGISLFLAPFYFWPFHPWSSVYAITFLMLSLELLLLSTEKQGWLALLFTALSGAAAVLAFWCRQPVGMVSVLAGVLCLGFLAILYRRHAAKRNELLHSLITFLIGSVIGVLVILIPIIATGALHDFVRQSLGGMFTFASNRSNTDTFGVFGMVGLLLYDLFLSPIHQTYYLWIDPIFVLLPLAALIIALGVAVRMMIAQKKDRDATPPSRDVLLLIFGVFAVANWHQYYPVDCYRHWYWGSFVCMPALLLFLQWGIMKLKTLPRLSFLKKPRVASLALPLAILLVFGGNVGVRLYSCATKLGDMHDNGVYQNEYFHHLDGLYLEAEDAAHYDLLFETVHALQSRFPDTNIINTTENGIYAVFGENFCPLFNNSGDFFYTEYPTWLAEYIASDMPIIIGPEAPDGYMLYVEIPGDGGDDFVGSHRMPANIYLPTVLYEALVP